MTDGCDFSSEIALRWTSLDLKDDKLTLVQVMAWFCQATSHYLNQCWTRSLLPYGVTRPQFTISTNYISCIYGLVQERRNSSASGMEFRHSCIKQSMWKWQNNLNFHIPWFHICFCFRLTLNFAMWLTLLRWVRSDLILWPIFSCVVWWVQMEA